MKAQQIINQIEREEEYKPIININRGLKIDLIKNFSIEEVKKRTEEYKIEEARIKADQNIKKLFSKDRRKETLNKYLRGLK